MLTFIQPGYFTRNLFYLAEIEQVITSQPQALNDLIGQALDLKRFVGTHRHVRSHLACSIL